MIRRAIPSKSIETTGVRTGAAVVAGTGGVGVLPGTNTAGTGAGATIGSSSLSGVNGVASPDFSTATYKAFVRGRSYDVMSSHCERNAKSVLARNQRYLPDASHAGEVASARPSVSCFVSPVSVLSTTITW